MSGDALGALRALTQQARAAADAPSANALLERIEAIAREPIEPTRELGAALIDAASALVPHGAPERVEGLFGDADRVLDAAGDTLIDDRLMLWHNLAALYAQHAAGDACNRVLAAIGSTAQTYDGPLQWHGSEVFLQQALRLRQIGRTEPMLTLLRQVHRYRGSEAFLAGDRLVWLEAYSHLLIEAGRPAEAAPVREQAIALAQQLGEVERAVLLLNSSARDATARSDGAAALAALERGWQLFEATPALRGSKLEPALLHNLVGARLRARDASRYADTLPLAERVLELLRAAGATDTDDFGYALYQRALLVEYMGDWRGAARGYMEAAAVRGVLAGDAAQWASLAGRAWFDGGEFEAAGDCYLEAVRRRVGAGSA